MLLRNEVRRILAFSEPVDMRVDLIWKPEKYLSKWLKEGRYRGSAGQNWPFLDSSE